jgi:putative transposase
MADRRAGQFLEFDRTRSRWKLTSDAAIAVAWELGAQRLRAEGLIVNHKAVARLMRQYGLQVRPLRKFVRTTDSDHDGPIFPNLAVACARPAPISSGSAIYRTSASRPASSTWR